MGERLADARTLEALDYAAVRDRIIAQTRTERGTGYAQALAPLSDFDAIRREQAATAETREMVAVFDLYILPAVETEDSTQRARMGTTLAPLELRAIGDALAAAAAAYNKTHEHGGEVLGAITSPYRSLKELQRRLTDAIDERGAVLDRASPALARLRKDLQRAQDEARDRVAALLRSAKFAKAIQDAVVTIREGRFVVPIKAEFGGEFPGIVHDTSSSGQTVFIEPLAALETNNRVRTLRIDEEREVQRVLAALSRTAGDHADEIEANVEVLARLDVLVAKARLAGSMDARAPELVEEPHLRIISGRHPLLGDRAIPQSLSLDDETRIIVISGPNMGGKTVAIKMVGLFVAMAYSGLHLPAMDGTRIGRFVHVFADIGDEQSIVENASTFSAHLRRMREIIEKADERSLVLVDEIAGGTEPGSGAALAVAMLERLGESRSRAIVTTHATELKLFAHEAAGVANASVRFDPRTFAPTFELDVGTPGQSLAFPLARSLGIPAALIARAEALLGTRERDYDRALSELSQLSAASRHDRDALERERRHIERLQDNLRARTEALDRERRGFAERAQERLQEALRDFSMRLAERSERPSRPRVSPAQSELLEETLAAMRRDLGVRPEQPPETFEATFDQGDRVRVLSFAQDASVVSDNGDSLLVAIGPMKTIVPKSDVRRIASAPPRERAQGGDLKLAAATGAQTELDVRGKRYVEAEPLVEQWIDEAILAENSPLRLIHGKGTGMLGRGLQEYLRGHSAVKNVRYGDENEGGGGVTVFELR